MITVYYFSTTTCGPCKTYKPIVQQVAAEQGIEITYVDAQQDQALTAKYGITSVPTIAIVKNGHMLYRHTGMLPKGQLSNILKSLQ